MTKKEMLFVAKLLGLAEDYFGNRICNDLPKELEDHFTKKEWDKIRKEYHTWNGDPEEYYDGMGPFFDFMAMGFFAQKLEKLVEEEE